jgi:hypothetical protein
MKKKQETLELEAELLRLNELVRRRRAQLARLARCPNKDCECRKVWRETIEKDLAGQMGVIGKTVHNGAPTAKARPSAKRSSKSRAA